MGSPATYESDEIDTTPAPAAAPAPITSTAPAIPPVAVGTGDTTKDTVKTTEPTTVIGDDLIGVSPV